MCSGFRRIVTLTMTFLMPATASLAKDCVDCHARAVAGRANVVGQMSAGSHHVQGVKLNGKHCYACHWEATAEGHIDKRYHHAPKVKSAAVELVIWQDGKRPTVYTPGSTAVTFTAAALGTAQERAEVAKITKQCLGCHSDGTSGVATFAGDKRTPDSYAWDGRSIASRYGLKDVVTWGKYSTATSNKKSRVVKALSAHGNAAANQGGWSQTSGYDLAIPSTRGGSGAANVECFDCHNSHGSAPQGITSSYRTYDGTFGGGILKQTTSGTGGYSMTYKPSTNGDSKSSNPYNAGAGLCFDCHETAKAGTIPWGYNSTFGAEKPILGYKDTARFGDGIKGSTLRYANRQSHTSIVSSHFKGTGFAGYSSGYRINGLCTPCHDPHGVSPTLGDKMAYGVPLLKGTWLTSPYREDGPPATSPGKGGFAKEGDTGNRAIAWEKGDFSFTNREANANFGIGGSGAPREPMSMAGMKYNIDRNTFGPERRIAENDDSFAGLCLKCHKKEQTPAGSKAALIHRSVKGWGANKEHAFPCAKCHQPHNSGLPRLMQTNCFQEGPSGLRESSGLPWLPAKKDQGKTAPEAKSASQGSSTKTSKNAKGEVVGCHVRQFGKGNGQMQKQDGNQWKGKNSW